MSENTNTRYVDRVGVYRCRVKTPGNGWYGEAGEKKTPFIRIPCIVLDEGDQEGREIVWQGWLSDAAFDGTIEKLCQAFPEWDGDLYALTDGKFSFAGSECEIVAESETYQGKSRIKAAWLNALGGGGKALDGDKLQSLLGRLGRKSLAIAKKVRGEAGNASRPPAGRPAQDADDNIPY